VKTEATLQFVAIMNSSGSSGIDRTSSEESDVSTKNFGFGESSISIGDSSASEEFDFSGQPKMSSNSAPFSFPRQTSRKNSLESRITPYAADAIATVNYIAARLRDLQLEESNNAVAAAGEAVIKSKKQRKSFKLSAVAAPIIPTVADAMTSEIMQQVIGLRESTLSNVSTRHRQRLVDESAKAEASTEFPILQGRCFNLSMNLKILSQSTMLDPNIAGRVLSDLTVLESSMRLRSEKKEEMKGDCVVNSLLMGLRIERKKSNGRLRLGFL
jgi:hypothetical protein